MWYSPEKTPAYIGGGRNKKSEIRDKKKPTEEEESREFKRGVRGLLHRPFRILTRRKRTRSCKQIRQRERRKDRRGKTPKTRASPLQEGGGISYLNRRGKKTVTLSYGPKRGGGLRQVNKGASQRPIESATGEETTSGEGGRPRLLCCCIRSSHSIVTEVNDSGTGPPERSSIPKQGTKKRTTKGNARSEKKKQKEETESPNDLKKIEKLEIRTRGD